MLQFNKEAIEKKQVSIDNFGLQIDGLSSKADEKALELAKIQKRPEDQLDTAKKLNREFLKLVIEIDGISHNNKSRSDRIRQKKSESLGCYASFNLCYS